jgi:hypothetical protein
MAMHICKLHSIAAADTVIELRMVYYVAGINVGVVKCASNARMRCAFTHSGMIVMAVVATTAHATD